MRIVKREAGQDLIEFALIAPILFVVLFGIVEFGVAVWRYNTLANTARETAREFVVYPEAERKERVDDIEEYARDYAWDVARIDVTPEFREERLVITSTTGITRSLPRLVVTVSYTHSTITGLFGEVPMRARASMLGEDAQ
jgi:Flp pilus assembly protein TadG